MWEERYSNPGYVFGTEPALFLTDHAEIYQPGQTALCVADGEGRNSVWLAQRGLDVTALEYAPSAVAKARRLAQSQGVSLTHVQSDVFAWDWPEGGFDHVVAIFIQFVGPSPRADLFRRMKRAVKPGGLVSLHGYTPKQLEYGTGGPSAVENLYTEAGLQTAFQSWQIEVLRSHERHLEEGPGHSGMSALIDLVARRPGPG
ncbi:SAM-dependent methyltransferase [Pseudooceanicola sp. C21-150M6]|uniref:SAM-dependent methyltransferase n=1 Tax=Pseudooceanicola sp. C21-150M6 TaxID=3434355 RepID=UPI003D7F1E81